MEDSKTITMEEVKAEAQVVSPLHYHPLVPFTRFVLSWCRGCYSPDEDVLKTMSKKPAWRYMYGGYRCSELGFEVVFHKDCVKHLPEINHSLHPYHPPLKLISKEYNAYNCSFCHQGFKVGYGCSISVCNFKLDYGCAVRRDTLVIRNSYAHEHPLKLANDGWREFQDCKVCGFTFFSRYYRCGRCDFITHLDCVDFAPEAYHTCHPQHPLKSLKCQVPGYADDKCLFCATKFVQLHHQLHHCDICNLSICRACMRNPPPVVVVSPTTHEHQLQLVPRRIDFTCNACGTLGDRSPYFCLECNFMIHWECIDLPRVININRHDHRISYTPRLGHGKWKCGVCRQKVDEFYGAYFCSKFSDYAVHARCGTRRDVWDMVELEGTPEEEELAPFEVIDDNTIKHFSHDHNLRINKDGQILPDENIICEACVFQICSSQHFYSCDKCDFILHEKCANLPRKKRHVSYNQPFTLRRNYREEVLQCKLCKQLFTGFCYRSAGNSKVLDVRCASISEPFEDESHIHPLYYTKDKSKRCSGCDVARGKLSCDECDFSLCFNCALLPKKVMRHRYDDHPLFLSYGERTSVDGVYWCEACETKVDPEKWFYTCNDCGIILHISCLVGDFSYIKPDLGTRLSDEVVSNNSICRPLCLLCNSRCILPSIVRISNVDEFGLYGCSHKCHSKC